MNKKEAQYVSKNELKFWQNKLGLNDWKIVLRDNCPINDFILKNVQGESEWDIVGKSAVIRIINTMEYGERVLPLDKIKVLIHELLHIKFAVLWESNTDLQNALLHQIIEELAIILKKQNT